MPEFLSNLFQYRSDYIWCNNKMEDDIFFAISSVLTKLPGIYILPFFTICFHEKLINSLKRSLFCFSIAFFELLSWCYNMNINIHARSICLMSDVRLPSWPKVYHFLFDVSLQFWRKLSKRNTQLRDAMTWFWFTKCSWVSLFIYNLITTLTQATYGNRWLMLLFGYWDFLKPCCIRHGAPATD